MLRLILLACLAASCCGLIADRDPYAGDVNGKSPQQPVSIVIDSPDAFWEWLWLQEDLVPAGDDQQQDHEPEPSE